MYITWKNGVFLLLVACFTVIFTSVGLLFFSGFPPIWFGVSYGVLFLGIAFVLELSNRILQKKLFTQSITQGFNGSLYQFYERLKVSFSISELVLVVKEILEDAAAFSVIWLKSGDNSPIYITNNRLLNNPQSIKRFRDLSSIVGNGIYYLDQSNQVLKKAGEHEAVLIVHKQYQFFIHSGYLKIYDSWLLERIHEEFGNYINRMETIEKMFNLSSISKEWELLAKTQKSFLPSEMPRFRNLQVEVYFQALVNVSGDYYDVIPIDEDRALLVLGDVSGKGLSAALIMGIIVNTIKIVENKSDLATIVRFVDSAIKSMRLEGKFTALFLGYYDGVKKTLRYINAGMPEPMVVSKDGIKVLKTNCMLIGIMDIVKIQPEEVAVNDGDLILLGSDGVTEAENTNGEQLGDTDSFKKKLMESVELSPSEVSHIIVDMIKDFSLGCVARDDITFLVGKTGGAQ